MRVSVLSGQRRQETLLGDVFVIGINWVFAVHILFPDQLWEAEVGRR
jgi:hypothetical protein